VDPSQGDKAMVNRPRRLAFSVRLPRKRRPAGDRAEPAIFGNDLETISAHWPMVFDHIHHFLPPGD
jgi:hypothetical protein